MHLKRLVHLTLTLFVLCSVTLDGQDYESFGSKTQGIRENSLFHIGPFYIQPRLAFRDIGYDSNVYFQSVEEDPIDDYTAAFSPEVVVNFLLGRTLVLHFTENPEYHHYFRERQRRVLTNAYSTGFRLYLLNRFSLSGSYSNSRRWARITPEFFAPTLVKRAGVEWSIFYESSSRIMLGLLGSMRRVSHEDPLYQRELDRMEDRVSFELYYRLFSESRFFLNVKYEEYEFENVDAHWRDAWSSEILGGLQFPLIGRLRGTFSLGYRTFSLVTDETTQSGLVSQTGLSYRIGSFAFKLDYFLSLIHI